VIKSKKLLPENDQNCLRKMKEAEQKTDEEYRMARNKATASFG